MNSGAEEGQLRIAAFEEWAQGHDRDISELRPSPFADCGENAALRSVAGFAGVSHFSGPPQSLDLKFERFFSSVQT